MLYKQAWQEFKRYIKDELPIPFPLLITGEGSTRETLLSKMRLLEERWKIIPDKAGRGEQGER